MSDTYYSDTSSGYDELHGDEQKEKLAVVTNEVIFTQKHLVLDVGCGTGVATKALPCHLLGIDPSIGLLMRAPFPALCGVGEQLPFKDNFFDRVISLSAFHHFVDPKKGLNEMLRVSKDLVIISVLKRSPKAKMLDEIIRKDSTFKRTLNSRIDRIYILQL